MVFISIFKHSKIMVFRRLLTFELSQFLNFSSFQKPDEFIGCDLFPEGLEPYVVTSPTTQYLLLYLLGTPEISLALVRGPRTLSNPNIHNMFAPPTFVWGGIK